MFQYTNIKQFKISVLFGLFLSTLSAFAAVEKVDMSRMLNESALVIQGTVISQQVQSEGSLIHTLSTIKITDTIKGDWEQPEITVRFLGGSLNGRTLSVSGQHLPELGLEGVFFIENPLRNQVNPLYGWEQGLFVVEPDPASGEKIIKTADKQQIKSIDFLSTDTSQPAALSDGVAAGIELQQSAELKTPYTLEQFKAALRQQLKEGQ